MNLTCSSRLRCRSSARAHIATWRFCSAAFTALHNSSTRSLKFAYSPPVRPVISVQINAQACAQQSHSTKVKGTVSISLKNCNSRWFFEDICQECQSWLYLPLILGLLVTFICNPGLAGPDIDESSLPCVSPSLLDPCPSSDCKAAFEDVHPLTGLSSKRSSLRPWVVNKVETMLQMAVGNVLWDSICGTMLLPAFCGKLTPPSLLIFELDGSSPWILAVLVFTCFVGTYFAALATGRDGFLTLDEACELELVEPRNPVGLFLKAK